MAAGTQVDTPTDNLSLRKEDNHGTGAVKMLDAESSLGLPKEKISAGLTEILTYGFETYYGGLFLIIPFLLHAYSGESSWGVRLKGAGVPVERSRPVRFKVASNSGGK